MSSYKGVYLVMSTEMAACWRSLSLHTEDLSQDIFFESETSNMKLVPTAHVSDSHLNNGTDTFIMMQWCNSFAKGKETKYFDFSTRRNSPCLRFFTHRKVVAKTAKDHEEARINQNLSDRVCVLNLTFWKRSCFVFGDANVYPLDRWKFVASAKSGQCDFNHRS